MDIIYPLIKTNNDNLEFRYSLRSLKYFKYDNIYIIWYKPKWIKNIIHIPYNDNKRKGLNVIDKFNIACNDERISKNFVWMNDDFFFLKEIETIPYFKLWNLKEYIKHLEKSWIKWNNYYQAMKDILKFFPKWENFDTHTPIVYNKDKFKQILEKYWNIRASKRSLYCNEYWIEWVFGIFPDYKNFKNNKIKDCKCYNIESFKILKWQEFLSSSDWIIKNFEFRCFMYNKFDKLSKYENPNFNIIDMNKTEVLFLQSLCPYKKGQVWMLRNDVAEYWEKKGKIQIMKNNKSMADRVVVEVKEVKDYKNLTKKELIEELEAKGINYKKKDNKQILLELLK